MRWTTLRTVVEELDLAELVDVLSEKESRFAEAWDDIKWLLCRTPDLKGGARNAATKLGAEVFSCSQATCWRRPPISG